MSWRLRDNPDAIATAAARIEEVTDLPASHVEKDFWVTDWDNVEGGRAAVDEIEKRFFKVKLLGRLFSGKQGSRRRAAADVLARDLGDGGREAILAVTDWLAGSYAPLLLPSSQVMTARSAVAACRRIRTPG